MEKLSIVAVDVAKKVFQLHGRGEDKKIVLIKKLRRGQVEVFLARLEPCVVALEACATAHHWARIFKRQGHEVRLIPPATVKGFRHGAKNDAQDAAAIAEAALSPCTRLVPVKSMSQQAALGLHRARELLVRQRTMLVNAVRGHLAEYGFVAAKGIEKLPELVAIYHAASDAELPRQLRPALNAMLNVITKLDVQIAAVERPILAWHRSNEQSRRLATIPGVGPITASAAVLTVTDPHRFRCGRDLAAWLGIVPRQNSTGGRTRLGPITKRGDRYLRKLLVLGATGLLRKARGDSTLEGHLPWIRDLLVKRKKAPRLVTVAAANKTARIIWALLTSDRVYDYKPARRTTAALAAA